MRAMEQHTRRLLNEISEAMERAKDEDREELVRLHRAVERHVEGSGGDQAGLVNSLEMAEVRFEVDHPTLAQSIRQVLESLSSSGI
jgi:replication-associated recombination protein RarA